MKLPMDQRIAALQHELQMAEEDLRVQLKKAGQSLRPSHLLKDALEDISQSTALKHQAVQTGITLATSFVLDQIANAKRKKQIETAREIRQRSSIWERLLEKVLVAGIDIAKTEYQRRQVRS